jgi:hypothetical protein
VDATIKFDTTGLMDGKWLCFSMVARLGNDCVFSVEVSDGTERFDAVGIGTTAAYGPSVWIDLSTWTLSRFSVGNTSLCRRPVGERVTCADSKRMPFTLGLAVGATTNSSEPKVGSLDSEPLVSQTGRFDFSSLSLLFWGVALGH